MFRNIESIPQSLIDAHMFNPYELKQGPISKDMVFPTIVTISLVSISGGYIYAKRHAK